MYEMLMHTVRRLVGAGILRWALVAATGLIVLGLSAYASGAFRAWMARSRDRGGWRGGIVGTGVAIFKLLAVFVLMRALIVAMVLQAESFEHQHGRITERNRSAVIMKWGQPHEQRELTVWQTRKRVRETRQLKPAGEDSKIITQTYWQDEKPPLEPVEGELPAVIAVNTEEMDVDVEQKSIVSADVTVDVTNNPRTLGGANYAGYDDAWTLRYTVANRSEYATIAHFYYQLPSEGGLFDKMEVKVGEKPVDTSPDEENGLSWTASMEAGTQFVVEISYRSRGLEHLRYIPRRMSQTAHYRVEMNIHGIPSNRLDYPIGSMPANEKLEDLKANDYKLTWTLDDALTSYDIGIKLPVAEQPEYHIATLMNEAPVGLLLLAAVLILPRAIAGVHVGMGMFVLTSVAYYLFYTFMGRLAELMTGFEGPFLVAAMVMVLIVGIFRLKGTQSSFFAMQDILWFATLALLYPLAVIDSDRTAFWMQIGYIALLVYVGVLSIRYRMIRRKPEPIIARET